MSASLRPSLLQVDAAFSCCCLLDLPLPFGCMPPPTAPAPTLTLSAPAMAGISKSALWFLGGHSFPVSPGVRGAPRPGYGAPPPARYERVPRLLASVKSWGPPLTPCAPVPKPAAGPGGPSRRGSLVAATWPSHCSSPPRPPPYRAFFTALPVPPPGVCAPQTARTKQPRSAAVVG